MTSKRLPGYLVIQQTGSQEAEQLYQPKISGAKGLKNQYALYADWETDFLPYQKESFQTFVVDESQRLSKDHKLFGTLQYKKIVYHCVHHAGYKAKGTGERIFTHTGRSGCPAEIRLNVRLKAGELEVTVKNVSHNQELTDKSFKYLPENRRLSETEAARVISLQKSGVPTKAIQLQMTKAHVRSQTASGLTCVQVLFASAHFILAVEHAASEEVFVYNSLDSELSPHFRYQLFMLFSTETKPAVHVTFPVVQKQLPNTNQCGPMVAAYMAEIVDGGRPDKTLFDKAQPQQD
ncbi:hypothetical protein BV898_14088 [Hypsibius exemplaris]|uniref:ZSWIM3 N-terminal domain-containing protein n=1 Tax=Hypsibius exemplaris TaxID=2072580 RepID=A0A1W0W8R2_HYPEX|nr:hypothetical protein BV898_14088 [Hypsibius exemplaris]